MPSVKIQANLITWPVIFEKHRTHAKEIFNLYEFPGKLKKNTRKCNKLLTNSVV